MRPRRPFGVLPRRFRVFLASGFGACCGCAVALLVLQICILLWHPSGWVVNAGFFLLSVGLGIGGALLLGRRYPTPDRPFIAFLGLAGWVPLFGWATRETLQYLGKFAVPSFLCAASLLVLQRVFRKRPAIAATLPRSRHFRLAFLGSLLLLMAGGFLAEQRARSQAEDVYDFFQRALAAKEWTGPPLGQPEIAAALREHFGIESTSEAVDRVSWQGFINRYEVQFHYEVADGVAGCKRVVLTPFPRRLVVMAKALLGDD